MNKKEIEPDQCNISNLSHLLDNIMYKYQQLAISIQNKCNIKTKYYIIKQHIQNKRVNNRDK